MFPCHLSWSFFSNSRCCVNRWSLRACLARGRANPGEERVASDVELRTGDNGHGGQLQASPGPSNTSETTKPCPRGSG